MVSTLRVPPIDVYPELRVPKTPVTRVAAVIHAPRLHCVHPATHELLVRLHHEVIETATEHGACGAQDRVIRDVEDTVVEGEAIEDECGARAAVVNERSRGKREGRRVL